MHEKRWNRRSRWPVFWIILILCVLPTDSDPKDPYASQPKIIIQNGNVVIKSATDRNVTLKAVGRGVVQVNDLDLTAALPLVRSFISQHVQDSEYTRVHISTLESQFGTMRTQFDTISNFATQLNRLEENVTALSSQMNEAFGGTSHASITNFRRVLRKVRRLDDQVRELTTLLSANECLSNPCRNGGTCVDAYNGFLCRCTPSWEGITCETDVNECAVYTGTSFGCQNGATCQNTPGSFSCQCAPNFFGFHCSERHDDCASASHEELCVHGTCINEERASPGQAKYRCICNPGWQKGSYGPACTQDVDECATGTHRCSTNPPVMCINLPGSFHCGPCPAGFSGDGRSCYDINECVMHNGGCSLNPYVPCVNTVGSRNCGPCPPGYVGNGISCIFQGLCSTNNGGCHPLATCIQNTAISGSFRECRCPPGYAGSGEGLVGCTVSTATSCANNPCQNGNCQVAGNSFHCTCYPGYTGTLCDQQADPCYSSPCQNGGSCVSMYNSFQCVCTEEFEGETCSEAKQSCGGEIYQNQGNLSFPRNLGEHYDHGMNCIWVISVAPDKVLNFSFPRFHVEEAPDCGYDFLEIHDGHLATSPLLGRFCGEGLSRQFRSTHHQIYLRFKSDHIVTATGFTVTWNATEPLCGGELAVATHGAVNSPGYPGNYPQDRDCFWLVRVDRGKRIQFQFATLQMEHHDNCTFDFLRILDGATETDPELAKFCSTTTPPPVLSSGANALLHFHSDSSVTDTGFHITYAAVPGISGCGGLLTAPSGTFTSPNFPDVYDHLLRCEWLIRIHPNDRIELSFSDFRLESHGTCAFDYVAVYDGDSDAGNIIGRYCGGTDPPPKVISNSNKLLIKFHTDHSVAYGGFRATYSTVCGGLFTGLEGSFHSPYFPDRYPATATCYYQIRLPPGHIIHLNFQFIDIEVHYDCVFDFLEIRDGPGEESTLLGRFCGQTLPDPVTSTYNELWLKFSTDGSVQNHGFYANYTNSAIGCGGVLTNSSGFIGTPSYQTLYPPSVTCTWLLRAPLGFVVRLTFDSFALEHHENCDYDYVLVQDSGGATIGKYCGFSLPPPLLSTNNDMQVTFVADSSVSHEGFNASYRFLDTSHVCGGDYYIESGVIKSPRYPENYPHSKDCTWVLHAPNGRQFLLNITNFKLEIHQDCRFDYLEIRNGGFMTSPLIGKYCGETIPPLIPSHSNAMYLHFHSDGSMSAPGFEIFFDSTTTGCGGTVSSPRSQIISPNYPHPYSHNAECAWLIRVSEGSAITMTVVDLDIESHHACDYDFLQIHDGSSDTSPTLARLCNGAHIPHSIRSTGNTAFLKFRTDPSDSGRGFHLTYHTVCNNVLKKYRGVIESPNFPNTYPHNQNCSWTIEAPEGNNITLSFSHLLMENASSCEADYIEVLQVPQSEAPVQLAKYCGTPSPLPLPITTSTNTAIIRLVTDYSVTYEGFRLEYAVQGCGGDLMKNYGVITTPNYPHGYPRNTACHWHIQYPPGYKVRLQVIDLDVEAAEDCRYDYLRVYAGEDENSPRLLNLCGKINKEQTVSSHGNHMFIRFYSDVILDGHGFKAYYNRDSSVCGGVFTADQSAILSPAYPDHYNMNDDCEWLIRVDPLHIVELEFYDFDVPLSTNCSSSYIAIYDGENSTMPLLKKLCGGMPENPIVYSTSNSMTVRLKADGESVGKGFKAHYKAACGQRLLADNGGEITSPNYPQRSHTIFNCSWILYASDLGERITLIVTHMNFLDTEDCEHSSLEIRDGDQPDSPLIQRICGRHAPPHITSQGSAMHVFLHSRGIFRATYMASTSHCGGTYTSASGSFASPEYPNNYPIDTECVWILSASAGNKIIVSFSMFDLEDSDYCNVDYVEIHENDEGGRSIGRYCGNQIPSNITAANKVWIKFRSDVGSSPGFLAHYGLVHNSELNGTSGVIESPEYPHPYLSHDNFQWTVTVPAYRYVSIAFLTISMPYYAGTQCSSAVKVYDGATDEAPELGAFCGYQIPDPVVSHGNQVTIKFSASGYSTPTFWRLQWNAVTTAGIVPEPPSGPSCWNEINLNLTQPFEVLSPNYPNNYDTDYNCTWLFRSPPGNRIMLNFTYFYVQGYAGHCDYYDKVQIFTLPNIYLDSWELNTTLCGRVDTAFVISPNNFMKMMFTTNSWGTRTGYNATAYTICGGSIGGASGMLNSSEYVPYFSAPNVYQFSCEWNIHVRPRRTIRISFDTFSIPSSSSCSGRYLLLLNGAHSTSPNLGNGKYCGNTIPSALETSSNQAFVRLSVNTFHEGSPRFVLRFEELSSGCGGQIFINTTRDYTFETPNYPNPPAHEMICDWIIMSPQGTRILTEFNDDEFHFTGSCYNDDNMEYVQLYDGGTELSEPLERYCGGSHATSPLSSGNILFVRYFSALQHPGAGIRVRVRTAQCGGTITTPYDDIVSPKYPENYDNSVECEWKFKLRNGDSYYFVFADLDTPPADDCYQTDYIEIRSDDKDGELIGVYCGNMDNTTRFISLPSYNSYVKFKSNGRDTGKGFRLQTQVEYGTGCGGWLDAPTGVITSPNGMQGSSVRHYCHWRIVAPEGRRITVTFNQFNLRRDEETSRCINSLLFHNGSRRHYVPELEFCGNQIPDPTESSGSTLMIFFKNNGWPPGEGFSLSYDTEKEAFCGGLLPLPSGVITTPNVTFGSATGLECKWTLPRAQDNQTAVFRFNTLDIPGNPANYCREGVIYFLGRIDDMQIYLNHFCGNMSTRLPVVSSPAQSTEIHLQLSLERPFTGINMTYNVSDCGGIVDGYNATITSPGYPNNYSVNTVCHWILKVDYYDTITVTITDLRMEDNCDNDYLRIYSSMYSYSPVLGNFCGTRLPQAVTSDTNFMAIKFHTDGYGTAPGFKLTTAEVERGCGGVIHRRQGYISSPNYPNRYPPNVECEWTIEYTSGSIVNLTFVGRFDIEMDAACGNDYLMIEDYDEGRWLPPEKKCGHQRPTNILSTSTKMRVTFHSNSQIPGDGFQIYYSAGCGGHFTDSDGIIQSPNYPNAYLDNLNCQFIFGQPGHFVNLEFEELFSLEDNANCYYDYVAIYRGNSTDAPLLGKYCGTQAPYPVTVAGQLLLEFVTDVSVTAHGFVAHYEITECGGNRTEPYGIIRSPKHSKQNLRYMDCTWTIFAQENRVISLQVTEHSEETGFRCYAERFEVREWNSTGEIITRLCGGQEKSTIVKSVSSRMVVRYRIYYGNVSTFQATYRSTLGVNQGCGGTKTSSSGVISSPDVDNDGKYEPELDCSWLIIGADDQVVNLTFTIFNIEEPKNGSCMYDYVEIRDGMSSGDPIIGRYCGSNAPPPIVSSKNKMTVFFHTDSKESRQGFRATYASQPTLCGNTSLPVTNVTQTLSSPGYPSSSPANTWCRWHIYPFWYTFDRVRLHFTEMDVPCSADSFVEIATSREVSKPFRVCRNGSANLHDIVSTGDVWVSYRSGLSAQGRGFQLQYVYADCNLNFTKDNGVILSPRYPYKYSPGHCVISVETSIGRTISLYFGRFHVKKRYTADPDCASGSLKVFEGEINSTLIATLCGTTNPNPIFSTGNKLTLELNSSYRVDTLYSISYTTTDKGRGCGGSLSHINGTFASPFYPDAFSQSSTCIWYLTVPSYHSMSLHFSFYQLTSVTGCETNYIELYEGHTEVQSNRIYRLCGDETPATYNSQGNLLMVKLVTDHTNTASGFLAHFEMNSYVNAHSTEVLQVLQVQQASDLPTP